MNTHQKIDQEPRVGEGICLLAPQRREYSVGNNKKILVRKSIPLLLLVATMGHASIGEWIGFGARQGSLAGAGAAMATDGFVAYDNPALLTVPSSISEQGLAQRFRLSTGLVYVQPEFDAIDNVITDNEIASDLGGPVRGNVSTDDYRATFGVQLGASLRLIPKLWNFSAGAVAHLPIRQVAYVATGNTLQPEYVLYRARTQRPIFHAALAVEPAKGFSVGAGLTLAFHMTSNANIFVHTDATKKSTMNFTASMKPYLVPYFGALYISEGYHRGNGPINVSERWAHSAGLTFRMESSSESDMNLNTNAQVLNPLPALPVNFTSSSAMYFDPMAIEVATSVQYLPRARLHLKMDYQFWSRFKAPSPSLIAGSGVVMSNGEPPSMALRDIVVVKVGHEYQVNDQWVLRAGYSYRPSIFIGSPTGRGNYLDPSRDIFALGAGYQLKQLADLLGLSEPIQVDGYMTYQWMRAVHVKKDYGNENGVGDGDRKIGAPGYTADGRVWGGGVSMTVAM